MESGVRTVNDFHVHVGKRKLKSWGLSKPEEQSCHPVRWRGTQLEQVLGTTRNLVFDVRHELSAGSREEV